MANLIEAAYYLALKSGELIALRLKDVIVAGDPGRQLVTEINVRQSTTKYRARGRITVPSTAQQIIFEHYKYALGQHDNGDLDNPLFHSKNKTTITERQLSRNIAKLQPLVPGVKLTLEKVRQTGICHYYDDQKNKANAVDSRAFRNSVKFSGNSPQETENIIVGSIPAAGVTQIETLENWLLAQALDIESGKWGSLSKIEVLDKYNQIKLRISSASCSQKQKQNLENSVNLIGISLTEAGLILDEHHDN